MPRSTARAAGATFEREARAILAEAERAVRETVRRGAGPVAAAAELVVTSLRAGGTVYFCGNGGSAADAQHFACELSGRFMLDRPALPAVALSTNTSALTAIGNDFGYRHVFSRQLEGVGVPGDVLVAITTSGGSANVLEAVRVARRLGMRVIGFTGHKGAAFAKRCDVALVTPGKASTPHVQEGHLVMGHAFLELVERAMFAAPGNARPRPKKRARA
jgi:D-sedoheptulose 7-phosphate isomerase